MNSIPLPPKSYDVTAQVVFLAQRLKSAGGYDDLIRALLAVEKNERGERKPKRKRKQVLYSPSGRKIELYQSDVKRMEEK